MECQSIPFAREIKSTARTIQFKIANPSTSRETPRGVCTGLEMCRTT
jgi:hypothetical protein